MTDTTRADKITKNKTAKDVHYADLYTNFNAHPETGFLVRNTDSNAVKAALRNLILTNKGERLFQPTIGSNIRKILFEDISDTSTNMLRTYIEDAIADHEPRVRVIETLIAPDEVSNAYRVSIIFEIINNTTPQTLNLTLYRVR
jgi:phage baseplate assembly protein W